ncbi:MAG: helix-turn-helix transcriptional regulator [Zhongshania sp.]|uniref:helix-turn-helix domain-containing protein n=1 Tax=Zhongshania sp. TaxID=1971902 RepID=UPI002639282A|nr:helix-turn-helix transcriptional regulator [Zhongshania sp.]MDF1693665.1 helix-turn-helix transcriptional regulator [Zhongshania sp.]
MSITDKDFRIDELLTALNHKVTELQRAASMAEQSTNLAPIEEAGERIRNERKKQGLTINELCDLSGVAPVTLAKIEKGSPNVRLESLISVAYALGMKLWVN